ncbi:MAG: haloacid dehalogenase-like hydrolase [Okeania sp. SIO3B5]|uniref:HAD family hydrolase n=1 Tax=Okeania sp. SIO3B5 TaxID=2607811 RepID=UPI00140129F7|nr:haloacid dehalogenase-like hydrolase [Okeania sp. SIO3B5]NEO57655.1 haloacid dehalogenase-like hydrolase [Okeania sp. SIO3B5]
MNFPNINRKNVIVFLSVLLSIFCLGGTLGCIPAHAAGENYLNSWNQTDNKQAIVDFVEKVTTEGNDYVEPKDRIAVFDNDGTLWSEKPLYFPIQFELENMQQGNSFVGDTTDEYIQTASNFVYHENQEDFNVPYRELVYEPVIGLVNYLKANDFKVYICSGGDIDFVRSFSDEAYGIPPEQVIGTAVKTEFDQQFGGDVERKRNFLLGMLLPKTLAQYNDQEGKPVGIQNHIGKRPIIAVGNSSGDFEMFQYTDVCEDKSLIVLINHDDCAREYEYNDVPGSTHLEDDSDNPGQQIEVADNESLDEAQNRDNWIVVSMQNDFNTIFESDPQRDPPTCN